MILPPISNPNGHTTISTNNSTIHQGKSLNHQTTTVLPSITTSNNTHNNNNNNNNNGNSPTPTIPTTLSPSPFLSTGNNNHKLNKSSSFKKTKSFASQTKTFTSLSPTTANASTTNTTVFPGPTLEEIFNMLIQQQQQQHNSLDLHFSSISSLVEQIMDARRVKQRQQGAQQYSQQETKCGVWYMSEISTLKSIIAHMLKHLSEKGDDDNDDEEESTLSFMFSMIEPLSLGLLMRNSRDQFIRLESYRELFSLFCLCFRPGSRTELKACVLNTMSIMLQELQEAIADIIQDLVSIPEWIDILNSECTSYLSSFHGTVSDYMVLMIQVIKQLSVYESFCENFATKQSFSLLLSLLERVAMSHDALFNDVIEIVWNMMEMAPQATKNQLCTLEAIQVLYSIVQLFISEGIRLRDREWRNDILILSSYLCQESKAKQLFLDSGFLHYLCYCSVAVELNEPQETSEQLNAGKLPGSIALKQTDSEQDFEMKKIMWNILFHLSSNDANCLKAIVENRFIRVLVHYLREESTTSIKERKARTIWNHNQLIELQVFALKMLFTYSVISSDEFERNDGYGTCLKLVQSTQEPQLFSASMSLLFNACTTETGIEQLSRDGCNTIDIMLNIATNTMLSIESRTDALHIIGTLCNNNNERNRSVFQQCGGIKKLMDMFDIKMSFGNDNILLVLIDCIRSCILHSQANESEFISMNGLYRLVRTLETGGQILQLPLLSCLIEFFGTGESVIEEVEQWKSVETAITFPQLLLKLWRSVSREQPPTTSNGDSPSTTNNDATTVDGDTQFPVKSVTVHQNQLIYQLIPGFDMELKRRIYHLLCLMGQDKNYDHILSKDDQILLETVWQLDRHLVEGVWRTIVQELKQENIRPTTPDQTMIDNVFRHSQRLEEQKARNVYRIESMHRAKQSEQEEQFYGRLLSDRKEKKQFTSGLSIVEIKLRRAKMLNNTSTINLSEPVLNLRLHDIKKGVATSSVNSSPTNSKSRISPSNQQWQLKQQRQQHDDNDDAEINGHDFIGDHASLLDDSNMPIAVGSSIQEKIAASLAKSARSGFQ